MCKKNIEKNIFVFNENSFLFIFFFASPSILNFLLVYNLLTILANTLGLHRLVCDAGDGDRLR